MELTGEQIAQIQDHLTRIHRIIAAGAPIDHRILAAWVTDHLTWEPGSRVSTKQATAACRLATGIPVTGHVLGPYVPWPRLRSNSVTWYLDCTLS